MRSRHGLGNLSERLDTRSMRFSFWQNGGSWLPEKKRSQLPSLGGTMPLMGRRIRLIGRCFSFERNLQCAHVTGRFPARSPCGGGCNKAYLDFFLWPHLPFPAGEWSRHAAHVQITYPDLGPTSSQPGGNRRRRVCELAKKAPIDIGARCSTSETSTGRTAHVPSPTGVLLIVPDFPNPTINNARPRVRAPVFRISTPLASLPDLSNAHVMFSLFNASRYVA